jgi:outer membrane receptor protein involved in Fe transport
VNGVRVFDGDTPPVFDFRGRAQDREQSGYAQDLIRLGSVTVTAGLRFDHYGLLVDETAWSPRLGVSYHYRPLDLVLRASYDRVFGTPAFENILLSAAPSTLALGDSGVYLPLRPSRGNYYEAGFTKAFARKLRLDASFYRRDVRNFGDDEVLLNTGVTFPVAVDRADIHGFEVKLDVPKWGPFSGYVSYSNMLGVANFPIVGGLFLEDDAAEQIQSHESFTLTQDQRNTVHGMVRWQIAPRLWTSWALGYNSGLPIEDLGQSEEFLISQYGADVVAKANLERGRVRPAMSVDASLGVDLVRKEHRAVSVQADVVNLAGRLNVINFAGLFSGTALAPPRSVGVRLRVEF